jgi:long-chain fatty acid transport protein
MRNPTLAIAALLVPAAALAGGYVVPNVNARDLSMAGSTVAAQDSAAAAYQNPAALAKLDGLNVSFGLSLLDFRSTWSDSFNVYGQGPVTMTPKGAFPPALYAAYGLMLPNQMKLGVGAGLTIPGGGYVFWPGDWVGRTEVITVDRKVYGAYLTAGLQVLPQLRVGGGLIYYRTTEHLIQGVNFLSQQGQIELGTSGGALSFDLSAEATPFTDIPLTVSVDYKHQGVQHLSGHAHVTGIPLALQPSLLDQQVDHTLTYPNQLNVGAAYQLPIAPLLLTAGWTWERFHVYQEDVFAGSRGVRVIVPRDYKNGYTFRLGGELQALPRLKGRAGILRDISPSRPETLNPSLPDSNVTAVSIGAGYAVLPNLEINAAYFHAFFDSIRTAGTEVLQGTYDTRANIWALNVVWQMPQQR